MNSKVDTYLQDGCGRCSLYKTPKCKVHRWSAELQELRRILNDSPLVEDLKWSQPCYTFEKGNVLIMSAFKDFATLAFFKGSLMKDSKGIMSAPGENSQASRRLNFTSVQEIMDNEKLIREYIQEAIELEKSGAKVEFKLSKALDIPEELELKFKESPALKMAFEALTPGRQRGYVLYFNGAKQSATRTSRIEKYIDHILVGKGFHDK
ncbi:MAG: YdeI/OmpD-associated family protein [Crocinitomicaceae bacterium]|nr:YdeI/OmpD-associated family protein [Crocinitomicaceae bacterium]